MLIEIIMYISLFSLGFSSALMSTYNIINESYKLEIKNSETLELAQVLSQIEYYIRTSDEVTIIEGNTLQTSKDFIITNIYLIVGVLMNEDVSSKAPLHSQAIMFDTFIPTIETINGYTVVKIKLVFQGKEYFISYAKE